MDHREARHANFELLRIVLMLLIISGHVAMYSGKTTELGTNDYFIANFFRSFTMVAVNTFVLITGYFGTKRNWKKILSMDLRMYVYLWMGFVLAVAYGIHQINIKSDIQFLFPAVTKQYWYVTIYFVLCIISPYINVFLENASQKIIRELILWGGVLWYLIATFCFLINANQIVPDAGYGIVNFVYLYCLGYYIRNYYVDRHGAAFYFGIYLLGCLGTFTVNEGMSRIMGFYFNSMISYNTIFTLVGAVGLFMGFKHLNIRKNRVIEKLSKRSLSVYLIHMCPPVSAFAFKEILKVNQISGMNLVLAMTVLPFGIYLVCSMIDAAADFIVIPVERACLNVIAKLQNR